MNKSKIDWCDMTWNPVTGCLHGCKYCYAKRITERFGVQPKWETVLLSERELETKQDNPYPFGFQPTFHKYRLVEPSKKTSAKKIFVCSMADLFGDWVPTRWIGYILDEVEKCPQHTFIFLTKNPERYKYFNFPQNCWLGTTVTKQEEIKRIHLLSEAKMLHNNKTFVSFEPLHSFIDLSDVDWFDWMIIGGQTGAKAVIPEHQWTNELIDFARFENIPVFLKDNLKWNEKIQEFPA